MGPSALASLFMLAAVAISAIALVQHLRHYSRPRFQVYILRILFMVPVCRRAGVPRALPCVPAASLTPLPAPAAVSAATQVYSIQSWLSLTFPRYRLPLSAVRDWCDVPARPQPPALVRALTPAAQLRGICTVPIFRAADLLRGRGGVAAGVPRGQTEHAPPVAADALAEAHPARPVRVLAPLSYMPLPCLRRAAPDPVAAAPPAGSCAA